MKYRSLIATFLFSLLICVSCGQKEDVDGIQDEENMLIITELPQQQRIPMVNDGSNAVNLMCCIYTPDFKLVETKNGTFVDNKCELNISLPVNQTYNIIFVAYQDNEFVEYNAVTGELAFKYHYDSDLDEYTLPGSLQQLDVYTEVKNIKIKRNFTLTAVLSRTTAQLNIGTSDANLAAATYLPTTIDVKVSKVYSKMNLFNGTLSEPIYNLTYVGGQVANLSSLVYPVEDYTYLSLNYLLVQEGDVLDVYSTIYDENGIQKDVIDAKNVIFGVNCRTNIYGDLLDKE